MHIRRGLMLSVVALVVAAAVVSTLAFVNAQSSAGETPESIGAFFAPAYGEIHPGSFQSPISQSEAEERAINEFLMAFGYPSGMEIEPNLDVKAAQGVFSGAKGGYSVTGEWDIHNHSQPKGLGGSAL